MTGMNRILSFGCSFTKGTIRIPEDYIGRTGVAQNCEPYPEIIAQRLGLDSDNLSAAGSGNKQIAWKLRNTPIFPTDIVIIAWSGPLRPYIWLPGDARYDSLEANHLTLDPAELLYETETCIRATNDFLISTGCKYIMMSALMDYKQYWGLEMITDWRRLNFIEPNQYNNSIMDICTGDWLTSKCNRFFEEDRTHENRSLVTDTENPLLAGCMHPSQEGHEVIADTLLPYLQDLLESPSNTQDQ